MVHGMPGANDLDQFTAFPSLGTNSYIPAVPIQLVY